MRILIVEDHPVITLALKVTLEDLGYIVAATAVDGPGVYRHGSGDLDVAIVDVNLADGPTGPGIASHLARQGVLVVFHTSDPGRIPVGFQDAVAIREKPSTVERLSALMRTVEKRIHRAQTLQD